MRSVYLLAAPSTPDEARQAVIEAAATMGGKFDNLSDLASSRGRPFVKPNRPLGRCGGA
jgi:hypothetical protein